MTPSITKAQIKHRTKAIEDCLKEGYSPFGVTGGKGSAVQEAARRLKISSATLGTAIKNGKLKPKWELWIPRAEEVVEPGTPEHVEKLKLVSLQDRNKTLEAQIAAMYRDQIDEESIREQILGLARHTSKPADWLTKEPRTHTGFAGTPLFQWSDWHCSEVVAADEVNGVNEFNLEIAQQRIRKLVLNSLDLCFNHMTGDRDYPGLVLCLLGDMISGQLHPELAETDEGDIPEQILWVLDILVECITELLKHFKHIQVVGTPGNHGRIGDKKPYNKKYVTRNADWLIYQLLERHFRGDPRVTFMIPKTGEALFRIYGHRYMAVHGDDLGVRGGDGIIGAIGPIMRGEIKMRTSSAQIGRDYDTLIGGHYHQRLLLPRATFNNTLKGYDEYARRTLRAVFSEPSQNLWFTHPKYGITAQWEVFVKDRPGEFTQEWVTVAA